VKKLSMIAALVLAACGGGDEPTLEGFYVGCGADGHQAWLLIDDERSAWVTHGYSSNRLEHWWTMVGQIEKENATTFSGSGYDTALESPMIFSSTRDNNDGFTLSYSARWVREKMNFKRDARDYEAPLTIAPRTYHGTTNVQTPYQSAYQSVRLIVDTNNTIQGNDNLGCTFSGNLKSTGRAYQKVTIKFNGGSCEFGTKTLTGVLFDLNENSLKAILRDGDNVMTALLSKSA
jgi:hypothetical protein